jgi:hypothetical protein
MGYDEIAGDFEPDGAWWVHELPADFEPDAEYLLREPEPDPDVDPECCEAWAWAHMSAQERSRRTRGRRRAANGRQTEQSRRLVAAGLLADEAAGFNRSRGQRRQVTRPATS